jgi:FkbM family methyltransferase
MEATRLTEDEREAIRPILHVDQPVVVELGAYCGEDEHIFRSLAHPAELLLLMVEPDPHNIKIIECKPFNHTRRLIRGAIAAEPGVRPFRFSYDMSDGARGSGSLAQPTGHLEHFPTITFSDPQMVTCYSLDQITDAEQIPVIDLLWVDIQGAEQEMIRGGQRALKRSRWCFMEAEEIQMYENQALKSELIAMMPGWELVEDFGYNILLKNESFAP